IASMTSGGTTRNFVFDYALKLPALSVVQQGGADLRYYVYLPNRKLLYSVEAADNSHKFYHFDEAGNTAFLTDDGANVTDSYAITPYGESVDHPALPTIRLRSRVSMALSRKRPVCTTCAAGTMTRGPRGSSRGIRSA
nr:hypothetical protein [Acidobacteriota bacterium]